jgi:hypothetical protein
MPSHELTRQQDDISWRGHLHCLQCQKVFRNESDARGARCKPRKDRGIVFWRHPMYWADKKARQSRA